MYYMYVIKNLKNCDSTWLYHTVTFFNIALRNFVSKNSLYKMMKIPSLLLCESFELSSVGKKWKTFHPILRKLLLALQTVARVERPVSQHDLFVRNSGNKFQCVDIL